MADSHDARAVARQHTARLLKMLRGYGPPPAVPPAESEPTALPGKPAAVTEVPAAYSRRPDRTPPRLPLDVVRSDAGADCTEQREPGVSRAAPELARDGRESLPAARERSAFAPIATVGESLARQRGALGELIAKAQQRVRLDRMFLAYLPPHLHDHAVLVRLDAESWVVHTDSASWATRLRYALHNMREALGQHLGIALPKPQIRVVPAVLPPPPRPRLKLTKRNAKLLEVAARDLADDRLSAALRRLAAHASKPPSEPIENQPPLR